MCACVVFNDTNIFQFGGPCGIAFRDVSICKYIEIADRTSRVANYSQLWEHVELVIVQIVCGFKVHSKQYLKLNVLKGIFRSIRNVHINAPCWCRVC